jgi:hypothetical protein
MVSLSNHAGFAIFAFNVICSHALQGCQAALGRPEGLRYARPPSF